ncbi:DEAD/DEAH box helicase [Parvularcula dongshanensis]|uniref:ATP-dependent RNA helicase RhlE n=1 Tax=Parvularcula dongshanensis TaxID=1173995 RepID=A0A840I4N4_9PROT|nr:DEAD/DEAH box helicase [Parvularcula dongshanensis]MBB4659241.1 ATP-dependent RNA helicase RhlE [Parvularcula dongshanensis]
MTQFKDLGLAEPLLRALAAEGHTAPTPIQAQAIPPALEGRDVLGIAQTGTGKTAAFTLPILHYLATTKTRWQAKQPRALVLAPTRELAVQIEERTLAYGKAMRVRTALVIGGVPQNRQKRAVAGGVDVLVATPGRLADMMEQGLVDLSATEALVLDECDQMLDMGFVKAVQRIRRAMPSRVRTFLFSATMPKEIERLAAEMLTDPVRVSVTPVAKTADRVEQSVLLVPKSGKIDALTQILREDDVTRALVFSRTKHGADKIVKALAARGIEAGAIHGNKAQNARQRALNAFGDGTLPVLVATDIAARGIDVSGISHVVQHDLPEVPEAYVHRIGRTARAGREGVAVAFCSADEVPLLRAIEKLTRQSIPVAEGSVSVEELGPPQPKEKPQHRKGQNRRKATAPRGAAPKPAGAKANQGKPGQRRRRRPNAKAQGA